MKINPNIKQKFQYFFKLFKQSVFSLLSSHRNIHIISLWKFKKTNIMKSLPQPISALKIILLCVVVISGVLFFVSEPDYNGKYVKEISPKDKIGRYLLKDIQKFKKVDGIGSSPDLKIVLYKVKKGESLWDIHKKTGLSLDTLISLNFKENIHILQPGQTIYIPNKDGIAYKIKNGETLESIAKKFNVKKDDIININEFDEKSLLEGKDVFIQNGRYDLNERINILGRFLKPVAGGRITSGFGPRRDPITGKKGFHYGIDIAKYYGAPVRAAESGRVIFCGRRKGYGKLIIIKHSNMYSTRYGHLSRIKVKYGQYVRQGQIIGYVGSTGHVTGLLYYEVLKVIEQGTIIKTFNNFAEVEVLEKPECENCKLCTYFSNGKRIIVVRNNLNAQNGDKVKIFIHESEVKSSFFLFLLPLIVFFICVYTGYKFFKISNEHYLVLIGFGGMFLTYFVIRLFFNIEKIQSYILEILNKK